MSSSESAKDADSPVTTPDVAGTDVAGTDVAGVLGRIQFATRLVQLRMRASRALGITPVVLPLAILLTAAALAMHKVAPNLLPEPMAYRVFGLIGGSAVASWLAAFFWPLSPNAGAVALDRHHELHGRLTNALEFAAIPRDQRTPLMQAAIDEACSYVATRPRRATLSAAVAAPLFAAAVVSWWLFPLLLVPSAGMLALVTVFEIRTEVPPPEVPLTVATTPAVDVNKDDLEALRQEADDLRRAEQTPEMKAAIDKFNKLIEELAAKRLDRAEAFRQMEALDRELLSDSKKDREKLERELAKTASELDKAELSKPVADAMKKNDLKKAEEEMRKLSERLKDRKKPVDKAQLKKLREAMKKAAEQRKQALAAIEERRAELKEQLLKKKKQIEEMTDPKQKEQEEKLLKKKERELEQLDRDSAAQAAANRELERLDRELADAAAQLMKELGLTPEDMQKAAEQLQKAAEDLNRLDRESMTDKEKEQLKKKLEELRELIRQEGKSSKTRKRLRESFARKANGKGKKGKKGGQAQQGEEGDEGEDGEQGEGDDGGEGRDGEGQGEGEEGPDGPKGKNGKKGKGQGQGEGEGLDRELQLGLGPGGAPLPGGSGNQPGNGNGQGGKDWGTGSGGAIAGAKTDPDMETHHVEQSGMDTGQGSSPSQTIRSAAERGFRGAEYEEWFGKYKTVAEEDMKQEDIPDGYRFYVQRYFQLIRPRE